MLVGFGGWWWVRCCFFFPHFHWIVVFSQGVDFQVSGSIWKRFWFYRGNIGNWRCVIVLQIPIDILYSGIFDEDKIQCFEGSFINLATVLSINSIINFFELCFKSGWVHSKQGNCQVHFEVLDRFEVIGGVLYPRMGIFFD